MTRRVSFTISQIAADAIGLDEESTAGVGRLLIWRRGDRCHVTCTRRDAERLIDALRRRATANPPSPELLIECSCAIQAIYEVHDPRRAPNYN